MPPLIGFLAVEAAVAFTSLTGIFLSASAFSALSTVVGIGVYAGLSIAANMGVSALQRSLAKDRGNSPRNSAPAAQDVQQSIRQAVAPRRRHYGRVKVGGTINFYDSVNGLMFADILLAQGEINSFEQHWLNDTIVTVDPNTGAVADYFVDEQYRAYVVPQLGTADQGAQSYLLQYFPSIWTPEHRARGIANTLVIYQDVPPEKFSSVFPQGPPAYRAIIRAAKVFDPRDSGQSRDIPGSWTWSDNAALCILDFLTHPDGMGRSPQLFDEASFVAAANACDQVMGLAAGGTERRYSLAGSYDLTERPVDVLARMLAACDGEIYQLPTGKYGLRVGVWEDPSVTIEDSIVLTYDMQQGTDALAAFNTLKLIYTSPQHDFQEQEAEDWVDTESLVAFGEVRSNELRLPMVQSVTQARRLGKIAMAKGNPEWQGSIKTSLAGLKAIGQRVIRLQLSELSIDQPFFVTGFSLAPDLSSVTMGLIAASPRAYEWSSTEEDGVSAPAVDGGSSSPVVAVPEGFVVAPGSIDIGGGTLAPTIVAGWVLPVRDTLTHEINYRASGAETWLTAAIPTGVQIWASGIVADGVAYEVRLRARGPGGLPSEWSATKTLTATASNTGTGTVAGVATSKAGQDVTVSWTNPASALFWYTNIYRATTNSFGSAVLVGTVFGEPSEVNVYTDVGLPDGTYYYWVKSFNGSNVGSSEVGPDSETIP